MNEKARLTRNIIDQIKETQIKLGFIKETVRLFYPLESLNHILGTNKAGTGEMLTELKSLYLLPDSRLGELVFDTNGDRLEVRISPEGVEYVHKNIETPQFLVEMIELFQNSHNIGLQDICRVFEKYSIEYVCEKMPDGSDFDYVLYFKDSQIDGYYYCIKAEMGHTIYHRFGKEDYQALL